MAFSIEEPFGPIADDLRFGQVAAMIGNTHLKKGAKPIKPTDFALSSFYRRRPQRKLSVDAAKKMLLDFADSFNKRRKKKKREK